MNDENTIDETIQAAGSKLEIIEPTDAERGEPINVLDELSSWIEPYEVENQPDYESRCKSVDATLKFARDYIEKNIRTEYPLDNEYATDAQKAGYVDLNNEQLISSLVARDLESKRLRNMVDDLNKKLDEFQSSCDFLNKTIAEQSQTLENRANVVQETEHERDTALQRIDDLTEVHERVKADAFAMIQKGGDITPQQLADALDVYSLAVARISSTDAHPQIVVALVQMAMHIRGLATVADIITWLRGSQ